MHLLIDRGCVYHCIAPLRVTIRCNQICYDWMWRGEQVNVLNIGFTTHQNCRYTYSTQDKRFWLNLSLYCSFIIKLCWPYTAWMVSWSRQFSLIVYWCLDKIQRTLPSSPGWCVGVLAVLVMWSARLTGLLPIVHAADNEVTVLTILIIGSNRRQ